MRRITFPDAWRGGADRANFPRSRTFGSARAGVRQRLSGVLSPESLFRLLLAFGLATALWLYVTSRTAPYLPFLYPNYITVSPEGLRPNLTVRGEVGTVRVTIRLTPGALSAPVSSFEATINLHRFRAGYYRHVPVNVKAFPPANLVSYSPRTVPITIEHVRGKEVPVRIQTLNPPPPGYSVKPSTLRASNPVVRVTGPQSLVNQVSYAVVEVGLEGSRSSVNAYYSPTLENSQGIPVPGLAANPQHIRVHAEIVQLASFKALPIVASTVGEPAAGFGVTSIQVTPAGLTAYGPPSRLSGLDNLKAKAVYVAGLRAGSKTFVSTVIIPRGVHFHPKRVRVRVTVGPVRGAAVTGVAVTPVGVTQGYVAQSKPPAVLVTLVGPAPQLTAIGTRIRALLTVADLKPGTYQLAPSIKAPPNVRVELVQPKVVTVTIRHS